MRKTISGSVHRHIIYRRGRIVDMQESVVDDSSEPDYSSVNLPSKERSEYSYVERRAELLQLIEEAGDPKALNQTKLAEQFGVSQQQISKDFDRIASHVHETMVDRDRRAFVVEHVVRRSIRGLMDEGEFRKAATTAMEYDEWIREFHDIEEMDERLAAIEQHQEQGGMR